MFLSTICLQPQSAEQQQERTTLPTRSREAVRVTCSRDGGWTHARARPAGHVGVRESAAGGDPAGPSPGRVQRLSDARAALRTFPRARRAGQRERPRAVVEDSRGFGPAAVSPPVARVFLSGPVPVHNGGASRRDAAAAAEEPPGPGAGPLLLAALRGGRGVFSLV